MTVVEVSVNSTKSKFEGHNAAEALGSMRYSIQSFRIVRCLGIKWTRKILWPTFASIQKNNLKETGSIQVPNSLKNILEQNMAGRLEASLDVNIGKKRFQASADGVLSSTESNFSFQTKIYDAELIGQVLRDTLCLISSYNVTANKIILSAEKSQGEKNAYINLNADIPSEIYRERE